VINCPALRFGASLLYYQGALPVLLLTNSPQQYVSEGGLLFINYNNGLFRAALRAHAAGMADNGCLLGNFSDFAFAIFSIHQHPQLKTAIINTVPAAATFF
jgi:hypothetical protein